MRLYPCPEKTEMSNPKGNGHSPKPCRFDLGRLTITRGALQALEQQDVLPLFTVT